MRSTTDHEYPPSRWRADEIAETLLNTDRSFPIPTYDDKRAWDTIRSHSSTKTLIDTTRRRSKEASGEPVAPLSASCFLEYERTGDRACYQSRLREREQRLSMFAVAECIDRTGEFLDDILDYAWAICEQTTWLLPAHLGLSDRQSTSGLPDVVADADRAVGLRSATTGQHLAELEYVLGDQLHDALRNRIRYEVDRRVLTPYEANEEFWWWDGPTNNWNAVCNAGAAIAALHVLDDVDRQARIIKKAADSLEYYLNSFDSDGCTTEGIGYWNYGFGKYVQLAAHLEERTDGVYSLLSPPIIEKIAAYPTKVQMTPGHFLPFSDTEEDSPVRPSIASWLDDRFEIGELASIGRRYLDSPEKLIDGVNCYFFPELIRDLHWSQPVPASSGSSTWSSRQFFSDSAWWLVREDPSEPTELVVAAKGGHNDESHNHNDCGTFVVHYGQETLLTDLGRPTYDRDYFSEKRYTDYLTPRSLGHSVPLINGYEQAAGRTHESRVVDLDWGRTDSVEFELANCYPETANISSLRRRVSLHRNETRVTVSDTARFDNGPGTMESVLVSYLPMSEADNILHVTGEGASASVSFDPNHALEVEQIKDAVDVSWLPDEDYRDVWRARIAAAPAETPTVELKIEPIRHP